MGAPNPAALAGGVGSLTLVALSLAELSATPSEVGPVRRAVAPRAPRRIRRGALHQFGRRRAS